MNIEQRLESMGLELPAPLQAPTGVSVPFAWARQYGDRVYLSGHGPLATDGTLLGPMGRVGAEISAEQACIAAKAATLALLASLRRTIGDLDRVAAWLTLSGMINVAPGFTQTTGVINPSSELLLELFGSEIGTHARTAIGMAQLPMDLPVVLAAEVAIRT
ncbi:RidA family protein [Ramlibacter sp. AW1]|uniref:RidA family protein n=1 Tax=Ramlibacter aurantiacus TaxID=2801330 RepID=A0A936ZKM0_9BURK|nr:RidA family protein [Ramlibacter aurantiacus]MBL0423069.1 RidA family protein [Ramlibacter aurantiacus]